jgi:hypothetical protein
VRAEALPSTRNDHLEREAAVLRRRLDELLDELDCRRRASRQSPLIWLIGGCLATCGGLLALVSWRRRRSSRWRSVVRAACTRAFDRVLIS